MGTKVTMESPEPPRRTVTLDLDNPADRARLDELRRAGWIERLVDRENPDAR